jgi:hypothetical protein
MPKNRRRYDELVAHYETVHLLSMFFGYLTAIGVVDTVDAELIDDVANHITRMELL